jgi:hypothetical protein
LDCARVKIENESCRSGRLWWFRAQGVAVKTRLRGKVVSLVKR